MIKVLKYSEKSIINCAEELLNGNLVAFPTETVYGLGANALNENALEKIFFAKGRPKSDPLIVHIRSLVQAESLTDMTSFQRQCFDILGKKFWPGPLTLIVRSSKNVSKLINAQSDSIAIRIPSGKIAQNLLEKANIPIAAPSANRFGHVSPTTAQHVIDDLNNVSNLTVIENPEICGVGIESTVIKIMENDTLLLLRPGAISSLQVKKELEKYKIFSEIKLLRKEIIHTENTILKHLDSPGQLLKHYSPYIESYIIHNDFKNNFPCQFLTKDHLFESVIIDFNAQNLNLKNHVLGYFDLSCSGNIKEASQNLFSYLRMAESILNAKYILLPNLNSDNDEDFMAIFDRIYRAASGKFVKITN